MLPRVAGLNEKVCVMLWVPWWLIAHAAYVAATILKIGD